MQLQLLRNILPYVRMAASELFAQPGKGVPGYSVRNITQHRENQHEIAGRYFHRRLFRARNVVTSGDDADRISFCYARHSNENHIAFFSWVE